MTSTPISNPVKGGGTVPKGMNSCQRHYSQFMSDHDDIACRWCVDEEFAKLRERCRELSRALEALQEAREVLKNVNEATRSTIDSAIQDAGELLHKWDSHD